MAKTSHRYFFDDTESRKQYFTNHFLKLAKLRARDLKMTLQTYLSDILTIDDFSDKLVDVSKGVDTSLFFYFSNMDRKDLTEFFNRTKIQDIVSFNQKTEELEEQRKAEKDKDKKEKLKQKKEKIQFPIKDTQIPVKQVQINKKNYSYFAAMRKEKKTGKVQRALGRKDAVTIRGKSITVYRDSLGRYVKLNK